jgi:hypothetical protein
MAQEMEKFVPSSNKNKKDSEDKKLKENIIKNRESKPNRKLTEL